MESSAPPGRALGRAASSHSASVSAAVLQPAALVPGGVSFPGCCSQPSSLPSLELLPEPGSEPVQLGAQRHPRLAALAVPPPGTEVFCGAKLDGEVCCQGEPVLHPEEPW